MSAHSSSKRFGRGYLWFLAALAILSVSALAAAAYGAWARVNGLNRPVALDLLSGTHDSAEVNLNGLQFFPFDLGRMLVTHQASEGGWYEVTTHDPQQGKYLGMSLKREISVDLTGVLEVDWRMHGGWDRLEVSLVEQAKAGRPLGEVFTRTAGKGGTGWVLSRYPISSFPLNQYQDPQNLGDRKLDPAHLAQVDLGIYAGTDVQLDIRSIRMLWDPHRPWMLGILGILSLGLLTTLGTLFQMRTYQSGPSSGLILHGMGGRLTLALTLLFLSVVIGRGQDPGTLGASLVLAMGTLLVSLPGCFQRLPSPRHPLWGIRNLAVWALAIGFGLDLSGLRSICAALIILIPSLESRDRRVLLLNAGGILGGVFAIQPFEMAGNHLVPSLVALAVLALVIIFVERFLFPNVEGSSLNILRLYEGLFHHSPDAIFTCTPDFHLQEVNPGFEKLTGWDREAARGQHLRIFLFEGDLALLEAPWTSDEDHRSLVLRFLTKGGQRFTLTRIQHLRDRGVSYGFQAIATDITREKQLEEELRATNERLYGMSMEDALTGVANRRAFDEHLNKEWLRACRHGSHLACVLVDVDFFKAYNDTYGHPAGDLCLKRVAGVLSRFGRRSGELFARTGGEEFALVLPQVSAEELSEVCQQMVQALKAEAIPHEASSAAPVVTISVGAAWRKDRYDSSANLLSEADAALYEAKSTGRCRAVVRG